MTSPPVVSNSSPLIALDAIGKLDLLQNLFAEIAIPPAVNRETAFSTASALWIREVSLHQPIPPQLSSTSLGAGETEAMSLALELKAQWLLLDDKAARRVAKSLGVPVIGTLGLLLACKRRGLIPAVKPLVDALLQSGFRVSPSLYQRVLTDAGESP
jgi:predicted nucleic acid-binding protein